MILEINTISLIARAIGVLIISIAVCLWCNLQYYRFVVKPKMIREYEKKGYATLKGHYYKVYFTPAHIEEHGRFNYKVDAIYEFMPMTPREIAELQSKLAQ